jgi:hypothetical protein
MKAHKFVAPVLVIVLGLSAGCNKEAKKAGDGGGTTGDKAPVAASPPKVGGSVEAPPAKEGGPAVSPPAKEVAFKGKIEDFAKEVKADKEKYKEKYVEVEGLVKDAPEFAQPTKMTVEAKAGKDKVTCTMSAQAQKTFHGLGKGQNVRVTGKLYFVIGDNILLDDCNYAEAGPNPAIKISAMDLGKEYATGDGEAAAKKYNGKELLVEGTVLDVDEKRPRVNLDAGLAKPMECDFAIVEAGNDKAFSNLQIKKGDKVLLKGEFTNNVLALKNYPRIIGAVFVKKD